MQVQPFAAAVGLLAALVFPLAGRAEAAPIVGNIPLYVSGGELGVTFGQMPFEVDDALHDFPDSFAFLPSAFFWLESGWAHLESGALVDLEQFSSGGQDFTRYSYGPGTLELSLTMRDGDQVTGTFSAPTESFSFVVCEGCDMLWGGGNAEDFEIELGPGTFDAALAGFLHIKPHSSGGYINFGLEDIDGDPLDELRVGFDHRGLAYLQIDGVEVPEPASFVLVMTGGAAWLLRRRRR